LSHGRLALVFLFLLLFKDFLLFELGFVVLGIFFFVILIKGTGISLDDKLLGSSSGSKAVSCPLGRAARRRHRVASISLSSFFFSFFLSVIYFTTDRQIRRRKLKTK
jgi:hypothetical protein